MPNIAFVIKQLSKHNTNFRKSYFQTKKRIIRYLKGIMQIKLIYKQKNSLPKNPPLFGLKNYANSNFIGKPKDCKSVMSYCFFLNSVVVF